MEYAGAERDGALYSWNGHRFWRSDVLFFLDFLDC